MLAILSKKLNIHITLFTKDKIFHLHRGIEEITCEGGYAIATDYTIQGRDIHISQLPEVKRKYLAASKLKIAKALR